jgi:hypothetical protein
MRIDGQTCGGGQSFDADEQRFPAGIYLCRLSEIREIGPKPGAKTTRRDRVTGQEVEVEDTTPRLVFAFEVVEGAYAGKRTVSVVRKVLAPRQAGRNSSRLYDLLRSLGVIDPTQGVDTEDLIGRHYRVVCQTDDQGRAWPESFLPESAPVSPAPPAPPAPPSPAPSSQPAGRWWVMAPGMQAPALMTLDQVRTVITSGEARIGDLQVMPESGGSWAPVTRAIPESQRWVPF